MSLKQRRRVMLLIETSNAYARGLLDGIAAWETEHQQWSIYLPEQERGSPPPDWLNRWDGDGIIARIETADIAKAIEQKGIPTVDVSAARHLPNLPWVETNDAMIAELALNHLTDRGFENIAFCGERSFKWSKMREAHFLSRAEALGFECHVLNSKSHWESDYSWNHERRRLLDWLTQLPIPVGIMASYDIKGQQVLDACRELGLSVPEQVAVIGVDNDPHICNLCSPRLTSIQPDTKKTGYEAANILHQMMSGDDVSAEPHLIAPIGIEERMSTEIVAVDDAEVSLALRFIRQHAFDGIGVSDVVRNSSLSRRSLESRFLRFIGRTPHQEIERLRMERVKNLLRESDLRLQVIAERTGFRSADYLTVAFKRYFGQTPGAFRSYYESDTT
ncbi:MAG: XylR family transcriptional regulator [Planctomycetales bacterium]|nr:XylR family transcriptional regulator [Planctomycetales bacterium]